MEVNTVIDVGCAKHDGTQSIPYLLEEFSPKFLVGFDPAARNTAWWERDSFVATFQLAAWTKVGHVYWHDAGLSSYVTEKHEGTGIKARCIDLAAVVRAFAPCVLKMDAEAAERVLIPHLIAEGVDELLQLLWIEWHLLPAEIEAYKKKLRCEVAEWRL